MITRPVSPSMTRSSHSDSFDAQLLEIAELVGDLAEAAAVLAHPLGARALGVAKQDHDRQVSELERTLVAETDEHTGALESYFDRARSVRWG
jgi:hypothetical protein